MPKKSKELIDKMEAIHVSPFGSSSEYFSKSSLREDSINSSQPRRFGSLDQDKPIEPEKVVKETWYATIGFKAYNQLFTWPNNAEKPFVKRSILLADDTGIEWTNSSKELSTQNSCTKAYDQPFTWHNNVERPFDEVIPNMNTT
ncbi:hypothetical protein THOM_0945 [Trachipleistophora hominis]|uniref:Uncharacterized protein n=1 Tax=Trachipleistophora hominis TaxID=72359 RepID=L7JZ97_TRAHO|nr:hypothetical protein THOM_0945 [Trachipleistophora hominis]